MRGFLFEQGINPVFDARSQYIKQNLVNHIILVDYNLIALLETPCILIPYCDSKNFIASLLWKDVTIQYRLKIVLLQYIYVAQSFCTSGDQIHPITKIERDPSTTEFDTLTYESL